MSTSSSTDNGLRVPFSEVLHVIPAPTFVLDADGRVVLWNQALERLTGIPATDVIGCSFASTVLADQKESEYWSQHFAIVMTSFDPHRLIQRWRVKDGMPRDVDCSFSVVRDAHGEPSCVAATVVDHALLREAIRERAEERTELARFVHDTISQDLVALSFLIARLQSSEERKAAAGETVEDAAEALELAERCCRDVRAISHVLAPGAVGTSGLRSAVEWYARSLRDAGLATSLEIPAAMEKGLSSRASSLMFAAIQEWSSRIIRKRFNTSLAIDVRANHSGFVLTLKNAAFGGPDAHSDAAAAMKRGWATLRERAKAIGGTFEVIADPGGVVAALTLPDSGPQ